MARVTIFLRTIVDFIFNNNKNNNLSCYNTYIGLRIGMVPIKSVMHFFVTALQLTFVRFLLLFVFLLLLQSAWFGCITQRKILAYLRYLGIVQTI